MKKSIPEKITSSPTFPKVVTTQFLKHIASTTFFPISEPHPIPQSRDLFSKMETSVKNLKEVLVCVVKDDEDKQVGVVESVQEYVGSIGYPKGKIVFSVFVGELKEFFCVRFIGTYIKNFHVVWDRYTGITTRVENSSL